MFIMVAASFFIVCGVSAAQHDIYAGFSVPSTFTFTDTVTYNVGNRSYGTAAYIDITWTWADYRNFYNSKGASISVAGADFYGDIELISVSASDPTIDCSLDGNRIRIYFNSNYNGNLNITLTYACNYTWYVGTITGSPAPANSLQDVTLRTNFTLNFGSMNYYDSQSIGMGDLNSKLNQILDALGNNSGASDFLGPEALVYFDKRYFDRNSSKSGTASYNSDGISSISSASDVFFGANTGSSGALSTIFLTPRRYYFVYSVFGSNVTFDSLTIAYGDNKFTVNDVIYTSTSGITLVILDVTVSELINTTGIRFNFTTETSGLFYGGIIPYSVDDSASAAINPDQSGLVSDVDNAGQQQQSQEEQLWTNINSYKGDLTFNLDDWSEAAGGLSYVSGIFMSIWNNSPTQIIVLSLMLGIAMLSIGRGAMAAVRVSRNRRDDD